MAHFLLLSWYISRKLDHRWNTQNSNWHSLRAASIAGHSLTYDTTSSPQSFSWIVKAHMIFTDRKAKAEDECDGTFGNKSYTCEKAEAGKWRTFLQ